MSSMLRDRSVGCGGKVAVGGIATVTVASGDGDAAAVVGEGGSVGDGLAGTVTSGGGAGSSPGVSEHAAKSKAKGHKRSLCRVISSLDISTGDSARRPGPDFP